MTIEHRFATDPEIHEPKGITTATAGNVYVANGAGSGTWQDAPFLKKVIATPAFYSANFTTQQPTGLDTPLQVALGPVQDSTQYFQVGATGTITCLIAGVYILEFYGRFSRTTTAGVASLGGRFLVNDVQQGSSVVEELDDGFFSIPFRTSKVVTLDINDEIKVEIARDSSGVDNGGLSPNTVSAALQTAGWANSPSASVTITRLNIG